CLSRVRCIRARTSRTRRRVCHRRHGVIATEKPAGPTGMSSGFFVLVFTSIVDTELGTGTTRASGLSWVTKTVLPSGVSATANGFAPTAVSVGFLVLVFTSIVDTVSLLTLATKAVLPSGVNASLPGIVPQAMSVGFFVLVLTSIV